MPGWARTLIVTLGIVVALVICALALGVVYVVRNKEAWKAQGREAVAQGKSFGANADNQGCLDESIARYKSTQNHLNAISTNLFMKSCLDASRPTPGFCEKVPVGDMMKLVAWREAQCRHYDLGNDLICTQYLFMAVPMFCGEQKRNRTSQ